jgi:hypothetical protein
MIVYDINRSGPTFPRAYEPIPLPNDLWPNDGVVIVPPTDSVAFAFTTTAVDPAQNLYAYRLYVRRLPVCFPIIGCIR